MVESCQQTVDDRDILCGVEPCNAVRDTLADIREMRCLTLDDAAEDYHGVETIVLAHLLCTVDELETARNSLHMDILGYGTVLLKGLDTTLEERTGDVVIPLGYDDAETHITCVWHTVEVVIG